MMIGCYYCVYHEDGVCYRTDADGTRAVDVSKKRYGCARRVSITDKNASCAIREKEENKKQIIKSLNKNGMWLLKYFRRCSNCCYYEKGKCYGVSSVPKDVGDHMWICEKYVGKKSKRADKAIQEKEECKRKIIERYMKSEEEKRNKEERERKHFEDILKKAESGDASAQVEVAQCYENGKGVEYDTNKCIEWYVKSAESGFQTAINELESRYYKTDTRSIDSNLRRRWSDIVANEKEKREKERRKREEQQEREYFEASLRRATTTKDNEAKMDVPRRYLQGIGVEKSLDKAIEWYIKNYEEGIKGAIDYLVSLHTIENLRLIKDLQLRDRWDATLEKENKRKAETRQLLISRATAGDRSDSWRVAEGYFYGKDGFEKNIPLAVEFYVKGCRAEIESLSLFGSRDLWNDKLNDYYNLFVGDYHKGPRIDYSTAMSLPTALKSKVDSMAEELRARKTAHNNKLRENAERERTRTEFENGKCKTCKYCHTDTVRKSRVEPGFLGTNTVCWNETVYYCYHMTGNKEYVEPNKRCNKYEKQTTRADAGYR